MKFVLKAVKNGGCRLGLMSEFGRHGDIVLETPLCMLYTRGGSASHLTADVLKKIQGLPPIANVSLATLIDHHETVSAYKEGIAKFSNMKEYIVYSSVQDPATEVPSGYNEKAGIGVWGRSGKTKVDPALFVQTQEALLPDIYQALSDGDTDKNTGRKRVQKSVDRTLSFLDQILKKVQNSERLKDSALFGVIEGGHLLQERQRSARETAARPVSGFVIEGFHNFGAKVKEFNCKDISETFKKMMVLDSGDYSTMTKSLMYHRRQDRPNSPTSITEQSPSPKRPPAKRQRVQKQKTTTIEKECLPDDKPRLIHGAFTPDCILSALELGVDIFDSSYPYLMTEQGSALVFKYDYKTNLEDLDQSEMANQGYDICLKDKVYCDDFGPVLQDCTCYTCKNFTRAYVNHLLNTSELLASVLLMIHNFQHYFHFFQAIRQSLIDEQYNKLQTLILRQKPSIDS